MRRRQPRRSWASWAVARRIRTAGGDRGATLILALVFITVIAVAIAGVLSVALANVRATTALREQAAQAAAAEAAAQIAINELRRGTYTGASAACFGDTDTLTLPPLPDGTTAAAVQCTYNSGVSSVPAPLASFPYALLTLPDSSSGEVGITVNVQGGGNQNTVTFAGTVSTTGTIRAEHGITAITNGTLAAAGCDIRNPAEITVGEVSLNRANPDPAYCQATVTPPEPLPLPSGPQPTAPAPTYATATGQTQTNCNANTARVTFQPGVYTSVAVLNNVTSSASCGSAQVVYDFRPGVYWFNFTSTSNNSNNIWRVTRGTLVAGRPTAMPAEPVTTFPTPACDEPGGGVLFVFGSRSQWSISNNARVQVCAMAPSAGDPPVAIHGLRQSVGSVGAQTGCVTATSGNENGNNPQRCRMLRVDGSAQLYVRGATYAPLAWIGVNLNNPPGGAYQGSFVGGVVARRFELNGTGNVTFAMPFSSAPPGPGQARTVVHLAVYVCPGENTCSTSGQHYLTAAVGLEDPSGTPVPGQRQVSIYAWNAVG